MIIYESEKHYIDSCASLQAKIAAIDVIIAALLSTAAQAATSDDISEYWLNDGQTQIKTINRGSAQIERSILAFERLRMMYVNRLNPGGRILRLVDSKNLNGNGNF